MEYKEKYLKYKKKYISLSNELKNSMTGGTMGEYSTLSNNKKNIKIAVCTLNQWVLDFENNELKIFSAIDIAYNNGAKIVLLPELVSCGYSCEDHFYEREVYFYSFNIIKKILPYSNNKDIIIALGCPIIHNDVKYNTIIFIYNGELILIRPKFILANNGDYREGRWFVPWPKDKFETFEFSLFDTIDSSYKKMECPIGIATINYDGVMIAAEICAELWGPSSINTELYLSGVDIILNGSGSYFEADKLNKRINLIKNATSKSGGVYIYSNLEGCDGNNLYFDGGSMISVNGKIINIEDRFDLIDCKVMIEEINLSEVFARRMKNNSYENQSSKQKKFPIIDIKKTNNKHDLFNVPIRETKYKKKYAEHQYLMEQDLVLNLIKTYSNMNDNDIDDDEISEVLNSSSCWIWDYLRRSGSSGFVLPLNGDADSAVTATIIYNMCYLAHNSYKLKYTKDSFNNNVKNFIDKFYSEKNKIYFEENIDNPEIFSKKLCELILNLVYFPTEISNSDETIEYENFFGKIEFIEKQNSIDKIKEIPLMSKKFLSKYLSYSIGCFHNLLDIRDIFNTNIHNIAKMLINDTNNSKIVKLLKMKQNKLEEEQKLLKKDKSQLNIPFKNIKTLNTYLLSQALPIFEKSRIQNEEYSKKYSFYLVLGSFNYDEILSGYCRKYDYSMTDVNLIGSLPTKYINRILKYSALKYNLFSLICILTAEKNDETGIDISYEQNYELGKMISNGYGPEDCLMKIENNFELRKIFSSSPNKKEDKPIDILRRFFSRYRINRNKAINLPPSVHLLSSSCNNSFNERPFLYKTSQSIYFQDDIIPE